MNLGRSANFVNTAPSPLGLRLTEQTDEVWEVHLVRARVLSPSMRRALELRVEKLSAEQCAAAREIEALYWRSNELTLEVLERQKRLRRFREILLNWSAP